jgi:hypothetical protein
MDFMATMPTDTMAATSGDGVAAVPRRRGKSKAPNFTYDGPVAVIRLELDGCDDRVAATGTAVGGGVPVTAGVAA